MSDQSEQKRLIYDKLALARGKAGLGALPLPHVAGAENYDDTILLEWIQSDRRLGFNVETGASESGWYVLVEQPDGKIVHDWGHMDSFDADKIVQLFWGG